LGAKFYNPPNTQPATPTPAAETPTPEPAPAPTPPPATPPPPPTSVRTVQANDLGALADKGPVSEPLLLVGAFRVSIATPAGAGRSASATLRPADATWAGQVRVLVSLAPGTDAPPEGETVTITAASRYLIQDVRRGEDGQLNVTIRQNP
ncbi:MAG: hypothetical protein ABMA13_05150, partial [Chthoniobacteraceae bacterium]